MKNHTWLIPVAALAAIGVSLFHSSNVHVAKASTGCTLSTLDATYGFAANGLAARTNANALPIGNFTPLAASGTFTFDGTGNISRTFTISFGGQIFPVSDTGTYTINSNCTGSFNLPAAGETWNFVVVNSAMQIDFVVVTPGVVTAGSLTKL